MDGDTGRTKEDREFLLFVTPPGELAVGVETRVGIDEGGCLRASGDRKLDRNVEPSRGDSSAIERAETGVRAFLEARPGARGLIASGGIGAALGDRR